MFYSPLRYPGGKNRLSAFLAKICIDNNIHGHYVEPYAGGASVALFLLLEGYVSKITINDKDRSIFAFWHSIKNNCIELCNLIDDTEITIENWYKQKEIQKQKEDIDLLTLGFSTLFLNRTNRSGIIKGGVIGGIKQDGDYKIDCRFNKDEIKQRIKFIAKYSENIEVLNDDAIDLIDKIQLQAINEGTIFYFDPPYYLKADQLYMNHYMDEHHKGVSDKIKAIQNIHWVVSYDDNINIEKLYLDLPTKKYSFNHSAGVSKSGKEIMFFSNDLKQPNVKDYNPVNFKIKINKSRKEIIYKHI
ncbi:DNA methyltransferase [Flavobacterium sp. MEB061]|uniref:DNA adenine methylase n=1 Tax=Flavobacterium sp. MEB061 TaxID=1587524 RepID=UPI0005ACA49E|nr:DNA adenine methylase [Flavobacterium sp. MEB061]KIQ22944.1 DNA methyltransferase [Flavobacterium sp. MEB061]